MITVSSVTSFIKFATLLAPALRELTRTLYDRHSGNVEAAKSELTMIKNHGAQLKEFEAEIAERMAALRAHSTKGPTS
jgi:epoxyqueuosine reductase QueG